jgi:acyl carrier protein
METKEIVKEIIAEKLGINPADITDTSSAESLGADSLDTVELIMELVNRFNIPIPDGTFNLSTTFSEVIAYINARI